MKNKYYKSLPDSLAKTRISKLVKASKEAWDKHHEVSKHTEKGDTLYDYTLKQAIGFSDSLRIMGIVEHDFLETP